jgi:putative colanic acid biosynthesis acetyltransferase WcaF
MKERLPPRDYVINQFICKIPLMGARVRAYARIGVRFESPQTSAIMMNTEVHAPKRIAIGANAIIGRHCLLDGRGGLTIGRNVNISSYSLLISAGHDPYDDDFEGYQAGIVIEDRVWIATRATILAGVTIGEGATVGAGAVVTRDVEPFSVVAGIPAKPIGRRPETLRYELDYRPDFL